MATVGSSKARTRKAEGKSAIFVDGNWLLHRVQYTKGASSSVPERVVPLNVLNYCCVYALEKGAAHGAILFDGGNNFRYKVYPKYKANRGSGAITDAGDPEVPDLVYANLQPTIRLFNLVGFPVFQEEEYEADDMVAAGANRFVDEATTNFSWIVCRDKDAFQAVRERINVFWPEVGKISAADVDAEYVKRKTGLGPMAFGDYQILVGDGVDNVPGILPPAKAKALLNEHGLLGRYFKTPEGKKFFLRHETELRRNQRLVRMDHRCWSPTSKDLEIHLREDRAVLSEFGQLPKSFYALRSVLSSGSRSLF